MAQAPELAGARVAVLNWRDVDHALAGGAEIYAWQLALAMREAGAEVEFLTARERGGARTVVRDGIPVRRAGGALGFYLQTARRLLTRRRRLDLVLESSGGMPSFAPLFVRRRTPVVVVVHHVHQDQYGVHFPAPVAALGRWLERVVMPRVYRRTRTLAVSASTRTELRERLGWQGPIGILENGAELPPPGSGNPLLKDPDRLVVLGRLVAHKRADVVLHAVAELRRTRPRLRVDVVGKGPERDRLERLADQLGLGLAVTFHGFVDERTKATLLRRAALHVCASDAEGWGQVVIEAAGHGVPTVARDVPGLRDAVRDGETGWLVRDDPDMEVVRRRLVDRLGRALDEAASAGTRAAWFEACQAWAHKFDWAQMRLQTRDLVAAELTGRVTAPSGHNQPREARVVVMGGTTCVD